MEVFAVLFHALSVVAVHYVDEPLRILKVVMPEFGGFNLTADIPYVKLKVLVLDCLDVVAD